MIRNLLLATLLLLTFAIAAPVTLLAAPAAMPKDEYKSLAKPGTNIPLDGEHYFTYGFDKTPKLGSAIIKVEIFTKDGKRDSSFVVKGDADMPSMRGVHSAGERNFSISAKKLYLLPIQLVMPGDWEIRLSFAKKGNVIFRGAYRFDI